VQLDLHAALCSIVRAASLTALADRLTSQFAASRSVVLVRVWFAESEGAMTLAGSAGSPSGGGSYARLDGEFREMAVADAKIHEIATSGAPFVVRGVRGDEDWLTNSAWAARQGVRAFLAFPLLADDQTIGVFACFDREMPSDDVLSQLSLIADVAAARGAELLARPPLANAAPVSDPCPPEPGRRSPRGTEVLTRAELRRLEKENLEAALTRTNGKVFGADGAAALLGMRPTTLASRLRALGIR
jgi:transcriptional regulator with GAF, ATPase, and Fis domain